MWTTLLGGIGLFLLGMLLLTEGLQAAAGDALRRLLARFTRGRLASVATGMTFTALVQSSSITTLATIGFVSAGLMTFAQSIGVILGANLGTTATSWLVSLVGLNVKLDAFALPLVGVGAITRLFSRGRLAHLGTVVAGFGLLFIGIEVLQGAMTGLSDQLDVSAWARPGVVGRLLLVGLGVVMTIIMQSSSAAVATTLTALHAGAIGLDDAAAIVIGQNVGTTAKAALGAIGASLPARRTAVAHIAFNLVTGALALAILPLFVGLVGSITRRLGEVDDAVSLAAFHTAFNLLGVLLFLPFLDRFAKLIERLVPERPAPLLWRLHDVRDAAPEIALEAARQTLVDVRDAALRAFEQWRAGDLDADRLVAALGPGAEAIAEVRRFLGSIPTATERADAVARVERVFHALDHLSRLHALGLERDHAEVGASSERLRAQRELLAECLAAVRGEDVSAAAEASRKMADVRRELRRALLSSAAAGAAMPDEAELRLTTSRWLDRAAYHFWRSLVHLTDEAPPEPQGVETERAP